MARRISRGSVTKAIAEHDRLGRHRFLEKYGFGESTKYLLKVGERTYDSKSIVGVAHGYEYPALGPLDARSFSGGISAGGAARQLLDLGFEIVDISIG